MRESQSKRIVYDQRSEISPLETNEKDEAPQKLVKNICNFYGVTPAELVQRSTALRTFRPREVAVYLLEEKFALSVPEIADFLHRHPLSIEAIQGNRAQK